MTVFFPETGKLGKKSAGERRGRAGGGVVKKSAPALKRGTRKCGA